MLHHSHPISVFKVTGIALTLAFTVVSDPGFAERNPITSKSALKEILAIHNQYRKEVGVPALTWSESLRKGAQKWADYLASLGGNTLEHSPDSERGNQGENLWMGTADTQTYTDMVKQWGSEKKKYRGGKLTEQNFQSVGHYTQIVWNNTKQVGCGLATAGGNEIFVCRYSPGGNVLGQKAY